MEITNSRNYYNNILYFGKNEAQPIKTDPSEPVPSKKTVFLANFAAMGTIAFALRKKGLMCAYFKNLVKNKGRGALPAIAQTATQAADEISYKIQPPIFNKKISLDGETSLRRYYEDIASNMRADELTSKRADEVAEILGNATFKIRQKVAEIMGQKPPVRPKSAGSMFDMDIAKKRYFSLPGNQSPEYSSLDPLLYQKPREEIVDIFFGYDILQELNNNKSSKLLNTLKKTYSKQITPENLEFVDECAKKLAPDSAKCYGQNSVLHTHELTRVGRIFRELMGITVD